jgi:hypothetical protein
MVALDLISILLAVWGVIISTTIGVYKILEYRRSLKIYLEWQAFIEKCHLIIANEGKRPVTIKRIIVKSPEDDWAGEVIFQNSGRIIDTVFLVQ